MRGRWRYNEKEGTLTPTPDDRVPYADLVEATKQIKERTAEQQERDAHPGNYL